MTYQNILNYVKERPPLYQAGTAPFWDDEHISKEMLKAHLAVDVEAASRKLEFMRRSARWIAQQFLREGGGKLLDLGCGPGIYAELFCEAGFQVIGIDFSKRSIDYAAERAAARGLPIRYLYQSYLDMVFDGEFDLITLIYCDFGVLPPKDRARLLANIKRALKPGGKLILDGFTRRGLEHIKEGRTAEYEAHGFWAPYPYLCIQSNYRYPETDNYLEQYVIVSGQDCQCYNIWNQAYTPQSLERELKEAGFAAIDLYDDVAGAAFTGAGDTVCAVAVR